MDGDYLKKVWQGLWTFVRPVNKTEAALRDLLGAVRESDLALMKLCAEHFDYW